MSGWKRITTQEEFPSAAVYERAGPAGPLYRVLFANEEPRITRHACIAYLPFAGLSAIWISLSVWLWTGDGTRTEDVIPIIMIAAAGALIWVIFGDSWLNKPWRTARAIDLDLGQGRFRVRRNNQITYDRSLEAFKNLTVDDHPDLEVERNERREKSQKGPGPLEKQHGLFGWFGPEGTERIELLYRIEWPKRYSLQEIAGAVNWAVRKASNDATGGTERNVADKRSAGGAATMNPPLD